MAHGVPTYSSVASQGTMQDFPLYIATGKGALSVPSKMTRKDFDLLEATAVTET